MNGLKLKKFWKWWSPERQNPQKKKKVKWWCSGTDFWVICENYMLRNGNSGLKMGASRAAHTQYAYKYPPPPPRAEVSCPNIFSIASGGFARILHAFLPGNGYLKYSPPPPPRIIYAYAWHNFALCVKLKISKAMVYNNGWAKKHLEFLYMNSLDF